MRRILHPFRQRAIPILLALAFSAGLLGPSESVGQTQPPPVTIKRINGNYAGQMLVALNKSQVLETDTAFKRVAVGSSAIADVLPLSDRMIYVLGKSLGSTNLSVYDDKGVPLAVLDIIVTYDIQGLKGKLNELFPNEQVEVRPANDAVILSGIVSSGERLSGVLAVAQQYAPGKVTNLMSVQGSQQVMLEVKFVEMQRNLARELGINPQIFELGGELTFTALTTPSVRNVNHLNSLLSFFDDNFSVNALVNALEGKGLVKTLAEPNLVTMSGDTATFLAGGEFPIPVAQDSGDDFVAITVTFKEFGVSLAFTPTVIGEDLINLVVNPEVSNINRALSVTLGGNIIPGVDTRRAETTVELRDGQSFMIAGLLNEVTSDDVRQLPWLGDIPVLGALFRSTGFQTNETELVIIVTPYLVQPAHFAQLALPSDTFKPPRDTELFFLGKIEDVRAPEWKRDQESAEVRQIIEASPDGGIVSNYGHIIQ